MASTLVLCVALLAGFSVSAPTVSFPINSQVPPVARIGRPFSFVYSPSTFSADESNGQLTYSLADAPSWLSIDSKSRRIYGTPREQDIAPGEVVGVRVGLRARDESGSASIDVTLVVSRRPPPRVAVPLSSQTDGLGPFSPPSSILATPDTAFTLTFRSDTFSNPSGGGLSYYSVVAPDRSPLPSWVTFSPANLSFSGTAPAVDDLQGAPQSYPFLLVASDVTGFAAASLPFSIVVGGHRLADDGSQIVIDAAQGTELKYTDLLSHVTLDGRQPSGSEVSVASTPDMPSWLSVDRDTWAISGTPPAGADSMTFTVVLDSPSSNTLNVSVSVNVSNGMFKAHLPELRVAPGRHFELDVAKCLSNPSDTLVSVDIDPPTPWMRFDRGRRLLSGDPPKGVADAPRVVIRARSRGSNDESSETLPIRVSTRGRQTETSSADASDGRPPLNTVLMAVLIPIGCLAFVIAIAIACCIFRRRRRHSKLTSSVHNDSLDPIPSEPAADNSEKGQGLTVAHEIHELSPPPREPSSIEKESSLGIGALQRFRALISPYPPASAPLPLHRSGSDSSSGHFGPEATRRPWLSAAARRLSGKPANISYLSDAGSFAESASRAPSLRRDSLILVHGADPSFSRHTLDLCLPTPSLGTFQTAPEHAYLDPSTPSRLPHSHLTPLPTSLAGTEDDRATTLQDFLMAGDSTTGGGPSTSPSRTPSSSPPAVSRLPSVCEKRISAPPTRQRRWTTAGGVSRIMQSLRRKNKKSEEPGGHRGRQSDMVAGALRRHGDVDVDLGRDYKSSRCEEADATSLAGNESGPEHDGDRSTSFYIMEASVARGVGWSSRRPGKLSLKDLGRVSLGLPYDRCAPGPPPTFSPSSRAEAAKAGAVKQEPQQQQHPHTPPPGKTRSRYRTSRPGPPGLRTSVGSQLVGGASSPLAQTPSKTAEPKAVVPPPRRTQGTSSLLYFMSAPPPPLSQRAWLGSGSGNSSSSSVYSDTKLQSGSQEREISSTEVGRKGERTAESDGVPEESDYTVYI